jgi:hypothetical protein
VSSRSVGRNRLPLGARASSPAWVELCNSPTAPRSYPGVASHQPTNNSRTHPRRNLLQPCPAVVSRVPWSRSTTSSHAVCSASPRNSLHRSGPICAARRSRSGMPASNRWASAGSPPSILASDSSRAPAPAPAQPHSCRRVSAREHPLTVRCLDHGSPPPPIAASRARGPIRLAPTAVPSPAAARRPIRRPPGPVEDRDRSCIRACRSGRYGKPGRRAPAG